MSESSIFINAGHVQEADGLEKIFPNRDFSRYYKYSETEMDSQGKPLLEGAFLPESEVIDLLNDPRYSAEQKNKLLYVFIQQFNTPVTSRKSSEQLLNNPKLPESKRPDIERRLSAALNEIRQNVQSFDNILSQLPKELQGLERAQTLRELVSSNRDRE